MTMKPQIEFKHVLGELSVNRNDPCEIIRELISNSYDAEAKNIAYFPLEDQKGLMFFDDGIGLNTSNQKNGITPWEAFFSIGKSTKQKGEGIGYKCQGSKLCFACSRILVATLLNGSKSWLYKIIDNPRNNLDINFDIRPKATEEIELLLHDFYTSNSANTNLAVSALIDFIKSKKIKSGTLIVIDGLDAEAFGKYFSFSKKIEESYVYNYVRFYTRQGDARNLTKTQGFSGSGIAQVTGKLNGADLYVFANKNLIKVPFGYPYLEVDGSDLSFKFPSQVSRLRDGRFFSRSAKSFSVGQAKYSIVMAIDGNRRAHEEYKNLDRKGKARSGIRLSDQRGMFISVKGIKICKYPDILSSIPEYQILAEGDSPSHYSIILDGDFDLVTNRNSLSKKAFDTLSDPNFVKEIKKFLDTQKTNDRIFSELLSRLKKESTENLLNDQIDILEGSRNEVAMRERFRIVAADGEKHLFLSPQPGEEYLVGVLYSVLSYLLPPNSPYSEFWRRIVTFSTQGIDSLAFKDAQSKNPLSKDNIISVEYKYEFHNSGPFNHALAVVDYIVAWSVDVDEEKQVRDAFTCFGDIKKSEEHAFLWTIENIEKDDGGEYSKVINVICLKRLIEVAFEGVKFRKVSE